MYPQYPQYPQQPPHPQHPQQRPPMPPKQGGFPLWGWILIALGVIVFSGFAGCAACVYLVGKDDDSSGSACNKSQASCRTCCANEGKRGGYVEQRRTRMNGARYTVCVCE